MADQKATPRRLFSLGGMCARETPTTRDLQCFAGAVLAANEDEARGMAVKQMKDAYPQHSIEWVSALEVEMWKIKEAAGG